MIRGGKKCITETNSNTLLVFLKGTGLVNTTDIPLNLVQRGHKIGIMPNSGKSINFVQI